MANVGIGSNPALASWAELVRSALDLRRHLLGNCECVIHLDAKKANRALDLAVPKKQLYGAQIARSAVDQRRLSSA